VLKKEVPVDHQCCETTWRLDTETNRLSSALCGLRPVASGSDTICKMGRPHVP
jgi:hypothetical protein